MLVRLIVYSLFIFFCCSGCSRIDVDQPVKLAWDKTGKTTDSLIIFLPGLYDSADTFKEEKIFALARKAGIQADMVAAGVHLGHLIKQKMISRVEKDLFNHLKTMGYKNTWFVGMSLGALNSLLFYQRYEQQICGVVALSPYLADDELSAELKRAGNLQNWDATANASTKVVKQKLRSLWAWLQDKSANTTLDMFYLGYGKQDKFAESIGIFSSILNKKNIVAIEGGHDWETGRKVWQRQLASMKQTGLLQPCH